ncbi:unnamed protein product [Musa hybrid cultivar]
MARRTGMWNERMNSMGLMASGVLVSMMPQAALLLDEGCYMVALKVKASLIGSFAPLRTLIDLMMVLDVS